MRSLLPAIIGDTTPLRILYYFIVGKVFRKSQ